MLGSFGWLVIADSGGIGRSSWLHRYLARSVCTPLNPSLDLEALLNLGDSRIVP